MFSDSNNKHEIFNKVKKIDISLNKDTIEHFRKTFELDDKLQEQHEEELNYLKQQIKFFENQCKKKLNRDKPKILLKDFLKSNPSVLTTYKFRQVTKWSLQWEEYTRPSTDNEIEFLDSVRKVYGDKFGEFIQTIFVFKNNEIQKFYAFSGSTEEVSDDAILNSIPKKLRIDEIKMTFLIHNHPNFYEKGFVNENLSRIPVGYISNGSISRRDIKFFDKFNSSILKDKAPVVCIVINEIGLSHFYLAGTSKKV